MAIYTLSGIPISDELYHHGIKGQKWGIRRFQNEDGSYTAAGKERRKEDSRSVDTKSAIKAARAAEKKEYRESRKRMIRDAANVHKMSDKELLEKIGRLQNEKRLMELTYDRLTSSADPAKNMMIQAGKKVVGAALAGAGAYAGYKFFNKRKIGSMDFSEFAKYVFPNPNKKN